MLSGELAELAGVTVRTLRHHQIGLLPEPPRSAGGYRYYDVRHLVRLVGGAHLARRHPWSFVDIAIGRSEMPVKPLLRMGFLESTV